MAACEWSRRRANLSGRTARHAACLAPRALLESGVSELPKEEQEALRQLWDEIAQLNRSIDRAKPWEALPPGESADLHRDLADWVRRIRQVGAGLRPFLPHTAVEIEQRFSSPAVKVGEVLFPRR